MEDLQTTFDLLVIHPTPAGCERVRAAFSEVIEAPRVAVCNSLVDGATLLCLADVGVVVVADELWGEDVRSLLALAAPTPGYDTCVLRAVPTGTRPPVDAIMESADYFFEPYPSDMGGEHRFDD